MLIVHKADLAGGERQITTDLWSSTRFLLARDGYGVTVTDVTITPGSDATYGYKHHTEICYCLEGAARFIDLGSGAEHAIRPGSLWAVHAGERFRFIAEEATRLISIFQPPLEGGEVNDAEGSFPPPRELSE